MAGIRVRNIPNNAQERHIKIHFSKPSHGGGTVEKIYFPLLNNNAVVMFKDAEVVNSLMKHEQKLGGQSLSVESLPEYQIFSDVEAHLNANVSAFLMATINVQDELKYNGEVAIKYNEKTQICTLEGNWYQLEWCWQLLTQLMEQQEVLERKLVHDKGGRGTHMEVDDEGEGETSFDLENGYASVLSMPKRSAVVIREKLDPSPRERRRQTYSSQDYPSVGSYKETPLSHTESERERIGISSKTETKELSEIPSLSYRGPSEAGRMKEHSLSATLSGSGNSRERGQSYTKSIRGTGSSDSDDDLDLTGSPYNIPQESIFSSLYTDRPVSSRKIDADNTFEAFSSLGHHTSDKTADDDYLSRKSPQSTTPAPLRADPGDYVSLQQIRRDDRDTATNVRLTSLYSTSGASNINDDVGFNSLGRSGRMRDTALGRSHLEPGEYASLQLDDPVRDTSTLPERDTPFTSLQTHTDTTQRLSASAHSSQRSPAVSDLQRMDSYSEENLRFQFHAGSIAISIILGDLLKEQSDAIVNPANMSLDHMGGVARLIAEAADPKLVTQCNAYIKQNKYLHVGDVMHTEAGGRLQCTHVIHASGPMWLSEKDQDRFTDELVQTFFNCFKYANDKLWITSLSLPAISTGVFNSPLEVCMKAFLHASLIFNSTCKNEPRLHTIRMLNNDPEATVTSIVILKTLLEDGIDKMTAEALDLFNKFESKQLSIPRGRQERLGSFSRTYTASSSATASPDYSKPDTMTQPKAAPRRSSSLTRLSSRSSLYDDRSDDKYTSLQSTDHASRSRGLLRSADVDRKSSSSGISTLQDTSLNPARTSPSPRSVSGKSPRPTWEIESPRTSAKRASVADAVSRSAPPLKQSLTTLKPSGLRVTAARKPATGTASKTKPNKLKANVSPSYSRDLYSTLNHRTTEKFTHYRTPADEIHSDDTDDYDGDDEGLRFQSLPADLTHATFREKFLKESTSALLSSNKERCAICLSDITNPKTLPICNHTFCMGCIKEHFQRSKPTCPTCGTVYGEIKGDQPADGRMTYVTRSDLKLPGYEIENGTVEITYHFPDGTQKANHPHPGRPYRGMTRRCFLPNSKEGREVLKLLQKAFDAKLTFTIGDSRTTGDSGVLTWNDIHHKTSVTGGPSKFGYPDRGYMKRVREELAQKGITG